MIVPQIYPCLQLTRVPPPGKTQVFHDQIEVKQKELQPWTTKINAKQAEIDVASSERDALKRKADAVKEALNEAQENLDTLRRDLDAKVSAYCMPCVFNENSLLLTQTEQLTQFESDKARHAAELEAAQKRSQVDNHTVVGVVKFADEFIVMQESQATVRELREKAGTARQKADEAKSSQAAATSQNKVLDSLLRLRTAGRIKGFHVRHSPKLCMLCSLSDRVDWGAWVPFLISMMWPFQQLAALSTTSWSIPSNKVKHVSSISDPRTSDGRPLWCSKSFHMGIFRRLPRLKTFRDCLTSLSR